MTGWNQFVGVTSFDEGTLARHYCAVKKTARMGAFQLAHASCPQHAQFEKSPNTAPKCLSANEKTVHVVAHFRAAPPASMSGRFHPLFLARDYEKCVVARGKCRLEAPPEEYKPLFTVVDFPSFGFRTMFGSWVVNRVMHPVSTPEFDTLLMFHAPGMGVVNLAEQFALDPALTREIAHELGVDHPAVRGQDIIMSTDLVVTFKRQGGGLQRHAYAVKQAKDLTPRVVEKLAIEQSYWTKRRTPWSLILDTNLPRQLIANMDLIMEFAEEGRLPCGARPARDVTAWIVPHLGTGAPLRTVCSRCDAALGLARGTALSVAYHLAVQGTLPLDLSGAFLPNATLKPIHAVA
ncbi:MAG: hypothetical protein F9K30_19055 [Dechloromonas sp.]|nr:MAG: hypothetical protein F9K30_19055 [Dechloromonas sp.]